MYFRQFYLGCLAHASYLIGSNGEAVVVDPQRDVDQYIRDAAAHNLKIVYVLETHLHADFVSGHRELAGRTGAVIVFGAEAGAAFPHQAVSDGDELKVGNVVLRILETPGHTPEGICVLIEDPSKLDAPPKLLTGDTLFIGDVGRPDLAGSRGFTAEAMAGMLFDSLRQKIMPLADNVEVYPAHGAGSMCGRNISNETSSTLGQQKQFNYALQPMPREQFISMMTTDLPDAPAYFFKDAELNRAGAASLTGSSRPPALTASRVKAKMEKGCSILDVRAAAAFGNSHIPGAMNIGLAGQFASWAGSLLELSQPLILVADDIDGVDEAVMRLARVGLESIAGFLQGGMYAWDQARLPVVSTALMPVDELRQQLLDGTGLRLLDVRRPAETAGKMIEGAQNLDLAHLVEMSKHLDRSKPTAVICQSGYRSGIATSILAREGFGNLFNVVGGMNAWNQQQSPQPVKPAALQTT